MLHYVHQLVINFVCLLFGAGRIANIRFIIFAEDRYLCGLKQDWPVRLNQNSQTVLVVLKLKQFIDPLPYYVQSYDPYKDISAALTFNLLWITHKTHL